MKEIQKKYKADKQQQNEELMKFYRENKINPAASCLPMLAQFPGLHLRSTSCCSNFAHATRCRATTWMVIGLWNITDKASDTRCWSGTCARRVRARATLRLDATS